MAGTIDLDDKLTLSFPEGFHVLDGAEQGALQFYGGSPGTCLSDPERHILISLGRKSMGGLSALLINAKDAARRMEASAHALLMVLSTMRLGCLASSCRSDGCRQKSL